MIRAQLWLKEDSKEVEEDEDKVLEEAVARLFATTMENQYILHVTIRIQPILLINIVSNLIML